MWFWGLNLFKVGNPLAITELSAGIWDAKASKNSESQGAVLFGEFYNTFNINLSEGSIY